jgi:hypothetical protein
MHNAISKHINTISIICHIQCITSFNSSIWKNHDLGVPDVLYICICLILLFNFLLINLFFMWLCLLQFQSNYFYTPVDSIPFTLYQSLGWCYLISPFCISFTFVCVSLFS